MVGAFDRFNYGDLLFPWIISELLKKHSCQYHLEVYGIKRSDLSKYNAFPTKPLRELQNKKIPDQSVIIVAGGEVLSIDWVGTHFCFIKPWTNFIYRALGKIIGYKELNNLIRRKYNGKHSLPWLISPQDFHSNVKVIYNSVGGTNINAMYYNDIRNVLSTVDYISVRDSYSRGVLIKIGLNDKVDLSIDSAIVVSRLFPKTTLADNVREEIKKALMGKGYICFQIAKNHGEGYESEIVNQLEQLCKKTGLSLVLLPIGRAAMHDDQYVLAKIKRMLGIDAALFDNLTIFEIMYLIANANLFIGSSLHGCITALSFGVPHIGLSRNILKLEQFLTDWEGRNGSDVDEIFEKSLAELKKGIDPNRVNELIDRYLEKFNTMFTYQ